MDAHPAPSPRTVVADDVSVAGTHEPFVEHVSFTAPAGEVTVVPTDPGFPQVALALALGGRVELLRGRVAVGGASDLPELQARTRLVDVADVTSPEDSIAVTAVVEEELALAERPASRKAVAAFLAEHDLTHLASRPWEQLPAGVRTSLLLELGALHPQVRVLVLAGPERHGGDHAAWLATCDRLAATGLVVIVLTAAATAAALPAARIATAAATPAADLGPEPDAEPEPAPDTEPAPVTEPDDQPDDEPDDAPDDRADEPEPAPGTEPAVESAPPASDPPVGTPEGEPSNPTKEPSA
ncbi:hypothetical protein GCM10023258_16470 [Terrabacter aeriphilus]|uniref:ABC transporter domain-containing protein n=1 Tax=Terrabacter aeriphilus TaxID=515662 RepID=A0ABP9J8T2_9MICO